MVRQTGNGGEDGVGGDGAHQSAEALAAGEMLAADHVVEEDRADGVAGGGGGELADIGEDVVGGDHGAAAQEIERGVAGFEVAGQDDGDPDAGGG